MQYFCTDFPGGTCKGTGEKYTTATARKIKGAADEGKLVLSGVPIGTEADLFSGCDGIISPGAQADIVHWSHSGYHVRDALGGKKNDPQAIETGLNIAIDKIWAALNNEGIFFSVHQTRDVSDGLPSEMFPVSHKFLGVLDDVPERIAKRVAELGGHVATVNFDTPLEFPNMSESQWEELKDPAKWDYLGANQARAVRLLNFITYDFSDWDKSGLEKLEEAGTLGSFLDCYKTLVKKNGGHINVKCAFQMMSKSAQVAHTLDVIVNDLRSAMSQYFEEMHFAMADAACETGIPRPIYTHRTPSSAFRYHDRR
jgi:hypothetical protein